MQPISAILDDLRAGKMAVLIDDEDRENEGDLVCAAEHVTAEVINFMLREGRGMLFVALDGATCDRLDLPPQAAVNTTQRGTAYTLTVDASARFGLTTGVSAADRAMTIRTLADPATRPGDLDRPGHVQPLRARDGGTLVRAGHTEGMVDLCRLAGLRPAAVGIEIMNPDGSMARLDQVRALCKANELGLTSVAEVINHRMQRDKLVERLDETPFENHLGAWNLIAYRSLVDPFPHVALTCGNVGRCDGDGYPIEIPEPTLVRMHSQNLLGDVFGDVTQPSHETLTSAMRMIKGAGRGAVVYLRHEALGKGLVKRLQTAVPLGHSRPTSDASVHETGPRFGSSEETPPSSPRNTMDYGIGSQILRDLGLRELRLITDHPFTPTALSGFGLSISEFVTPEAAH